VILCEAEENLLKEQERLYEEVKKDDAEKEAKNAKIKENSESHFTELFGTVEKHKET